MRTNEKRRPRKGAKPKGSSTKRLQPDITRNELIFEGMMLVFFFLMFLLMWLGECVL